MRAALLSLSLLPYAVFATRDFRYHRTLRRVPWTEEAVHAVLALVLAGAIAAAFRDQLARFALAMGVFVIAGGIDELLFHRALPHEESDVHAKEHFTLLIFVVATLLSHRGLDTAATFDRIVHPW